MDFHPEVKGILLPFVKGLAGRRAMEDLAPGRDIDELDQAFGDWSAVHALFDN
ncbi:hypothetical protein ACFXPQ_30320 [Streptomyces lydicus]|uniref:hypothetical protein n=1 Tax=Streptomyces lydicus TaxID=47763 RepID=UPI00368F93FF